MNTIILLGFVALLIFTFYGLVSFLAFVFKYKPEKFDAVTDTLVYAIHGAWFSSFTLITTAYYLTLVA